MISVAVMDEQSHVRLPRGRIVEAVRVALESGRVTRARMSVAVVDDAQIHQLNRRFLHHDEPTDVLSFPLGRTSRGLEGEIIVSAERAAAVANQYGWSPENELLLYIIHGTLHLAGFDDTSARQRQIMRRQEAACLRRLGIPIPSCPKKRPRNRNRSGSKPPSSPSKPKR